MRLTVWDLFLFLHRHRGKLLLSALLCTAAVYLYTGAVQTYSADVIIRYKDDCIAAGAAPDGTPFDPDEIAAPSVAAQAGWDLPVEEGDIRANTTVTHIHGAAFLVRYRGGKSPARTRDTLDRLIDAYLQYYTERYVRPIALSEIDYSLNSGPFSEREQVDLLQDNISRALRVLEDCAEDESFRSPVSGLSFRDLADEFSHLSRFQLSRLQAKLDAGQAAGEDIQSVLDQLRKLYAEAEQLIDSYSACHPHVECLTGIRVYSNIYRAPCVLAAALTGLALSAMAAVVYEITREHGRRARQEP